MKKLITAAILFALVILGIGGAAIVREHQKSDRSGEYAVRLNEIACCCLAGLLFIAAARLQFRSAG